MPPKLGIILPDDPIDSEMHRLDVWLEASGRRDVTARTLLSKITGGHVEADLHRTGSLDVIGPVGRQLAAEGCDAVVWACTSGSFIGGLDWAKAQAASLADAAGRPATSTTLAFIAALDFLEIRRVHVLGAYPEPVTRIFVTCLGDAGIAVERWCSLGSPDGPSSFSLSLIGEIDRFAEALPREDKAPILVPDTAINSLDLIDSLERRTGRMMLAANQVSLWHGLSLLGIAPAMPGLGRLFAEAAS
jgi:maleate isomerase